MECGPVVAHRFNGMEDEMRKIAVCLLIAASGVLATACTPASGGVPMGGRDYDGKPPYTAGCDPNGVKMFQPDSCK